MNNAILDATKDALRLGDVCVRFSLSIYGYEGPHKVMDECKVSE